MRAVTGKLFAILFALLLLSVTTAKAQELSVGTDIVSRYIWRGIDLGGNTPSIQPTLEFSTGGFAVGFWGAYSLSDPACRLE